MKTSAKRVTAVRATVRPRRPIGIPSGLVALYEKSHERGQEAIREAIGIVRGYLRACKEQYPDHYPDEITVENFTAEDLVLITNISRSIYNAWLQRHH